MKISVITVSFNSVATIRDTLDSVVRQLHPDVEHLVMDGASTDGTVALVAGYHSPSIRLHSQRDNGMYDAMNKGVMLAQGEVVGFLNSDDYFADEYALSKVAQVFSDPRVDACFGDLLYVSPASKLPVRFWKSRPFAPGDFATGWCPAHPTFYVRRSAFLRLGGFDHSYRLGADVELMMRYLERARLPSAYIPSVLVHMRTGGVSNRSWKNVVLQNQEICRALRNNQVRYSPWLFWVCKLARRAHQFASARLHSRV